MGAPPRATRWLLASLAALRAAAGANPGAMAGLQLLLKRAAQAKPKMFSERQRLHPDDALALYQLTHSVARIFERHGVSYWATGGSLLGMIRNKGVIPHDNDVDLNILRRDLPRLTGEIQSDLALNGLKLMPVLGLSRGWHWKIAEKGNDMRNYFLDVLLMEERDGALRYRKGMFDRESFPLGTTADLVPMPFGQTTLLAPERGVSEAYLDFVYPGWRSAAACQGSDHDCGLVEDGQWAVTGMALPGGPIAEPSFSSLPAPTFVL